MKLVLTLAFVFVTVNAARADNFVFETSTAQLVIRQDGIVSRLTEKQNNHSRLRSEELPFATVTKAGRIFPASKVEPNGDLLHVSFGSSGVSADYHITTLADSIVVELAKVQGEGVQEIRLLQLSTRLANAGGLLGVEWDDDFAVCLMGLSERVEVKIAGRTISASVYPRFSMQGERVALIAVPTPRFLKAVQRVERNFRLPSPTIDGRWTKLSTDARTSYLFIDLSEANVGETIRYAKLGGFRYILIYDSTWSSSLGSYPINLKCFPHGEEGLKSVIDKCHAAGLKVGMHMMMSSVGKNDPLVGPKPNPGLLKDGEAALAASVDKRGTQLAAVSPLGAVEASGHVGDFQVDDEILHCGKIDGTKLMDCRRGFAGTIPAPHRAGVMIQRLDDQGSSYYLADPGSPLEEILSKRIADVINRAGFDMIYLDGGGANGPQSESWYWAGMQPSQIWRQSKRDLLMQSGGISNWSWHILSRGTCDDAVVVAVKEYLDDHKIADSWRYYHTNFLPAELGWLGIYSSAPDHAATTPDEIEYYAVRMLALDSAASFETGLSTLKANGRTEEMLKLFGKYEQLRLNGTVPKAMRERLAQGEWHMTRKGEFHPIHYETQRTGVPGDLTVNNQFDRQPLKFRLQVEPQLAAPDDPSNLSLFKSKQPIEIPAPAATAAMPGALVQRTVFGKALDLTEHRALVVQLEADGPILASGPAPVLNLQIEAGGGRYRDYLIALNFQGRKTVVLAEPDEARMLAEFQPAASNYPIKSALFSFNYANVVALNLRWMRYPAAGGLKCSVRLVEALAERSEVLSNVEISTGLERMLIPGTMSMGEYAEYWGNGSVRIFDENGVLLRTMPVNRALELKAGENRLEVKAAGSGSVKLTAITLGKRAVNRNR